MAVGKGGRRGERAGGNRHCNVVNKKQGLLIGSCEEGGAAVPNNWQHRRSSVYLKGISKCAAACLLLA